MLLVPLKKYTIDDLPNQVHNIADLRKRTRILIVDDEEFSLKDALSKYGFDITIKDTWDDIKDAEPYDVIVSDNRGVAPKFKSSGEGAFVLSEIQRLYPHKSCIIYSNSTIDFGHTRHLAGIKQLKKTDDATEWVDILSECIDETYNPHEIWNKIEKILKSQNIPRRIQRKIEDRYVRALLQKGQNANWYSNSWKLDSETIEVVSALIKAALSVYVTIAP